MLYKNIKTGKVYRLLNTVINTTNKDDGEVMLLYEALVGHVTPFVRERNEFYKKFEPIPLEESSKYIEEEEELSECPSYYTKQAIRYNLEKYKEEYSNTLRQMESASKIGQYELTILISDEVANLLSYKGFHVKYVLNNEYNISWR